MSEVTNSNLPNSTLSAADTTAVPNISDPRSTTPTNASDVLEDKSHTPSKSSAAAIANAPDPPKGKELRSVITGIEGMHFHCSEIDTEEFLERFLPGEDLTAEADKNRYNIAEKFGWPGVLEKDLNVEIVRIPIICCFCI